MSDWKEYILGDVINFKRGYDLPNSKRIRGKYPIVSSSGITDYHYEFKHKGPGVVTGRYGTIGKVFYIDKPYWPLNTALYVTDFKGNFPKFIFYFLHCIDYEKYSDKSTVPGINRNHIHLEKVVIPSHREQCAIASILSSLDDKIDLLHRQNATLEKMADTLFKQKFIEEATSEWKTEKLGDIAEVQNGYAFSSNGYVEFRPGHLEVLKMGHIERGGGLRTNPKKDFVPRADKFKRWILDKGDIIMAMTDMKDNVVILGVPAMIDVDDKYVLNQRVARIYLKSSEKLMNNYLLYIQLKDPDFVAILQSKANSGVQVNLSTEKIKECDIVIPPMEVQRDIGKAITDLYLKKEKSDLQLKTLTTLRDTLLPKLMSGEVRVEM
jgi:type I restriction enzyme S subunit